MNAQCHKCGKVGHIKPVCKSPSKSHKPVGDVRHVQTEQGESSKEYPLFNVPGTSTSKPYQITLEVSGHPMTMEIDTGASLSLVSETTYQRWWPRKRLLPTTAKLRTYSGENLSVLGTLLVQVNHKGQNATLSLIVVKEDGPSLLGRDWLNKLQLDWQEVHQLHQDALKELLEKYKGVFEDSLGTLKGYEAKILVDSNVPPRFCKARSVPYSMRVLVEEKLDQLVQEGIIEPVQYADWAAPIVPVLKSDKKFIRICGDFKLTVNQASRLNKYPIPKIEDLCAKLAGGKLFTKLDMRQAYQQLLLDDASKQQHPARLI